MLNVHPGNAVTAIQTSDPTNVLIGVREWGDLTVSDFLRTVVSAAPRTFGTGHLKRVEFITMPGDGDMTLETWAETMGKNATDPETQAEYMIALKNGGADAIMDEEWRRSKSGWTVYSGAIAVYFCGETVMGLERDMQKSFMVPDHTVDELRRAIEGIFGEGNVFVSKQVIPAQEMYVTWNEFYDQGEAALVYGERYWRHKYDVQQHPAGELYIPTYAIPVSIMTKWDRVIDVEEHEAFMEKFNGPIMGMSELNHTLQSIHPGAKWLYQSVCSRDMLMDAMTLMRKRAYVSLSSADEDTQSPAPSTIGQRIKRFWGARRKCGEGSK